MNWYTLSEFPNYEINELGQVKSKKSSKILSQSLSTKGYYQINIDKKSRRVHRLIAETFIPNPMNYETVNHKNGNKLDNSLENLEWVSRSENVKHSREILGLIPIPYSKTNKQHHLKSKTGSESNKGKSIYLLLDNGEKQVFGSALEAGRILFNDEMNAGKGIRDAIKRNTTYKKHKFFENET